MRGTPDRTAPRADRLQLGPTGLASVEPRAALLRATDLGNSGDQPWGENRDRGHRALESAQWARQKIVERRIEAYDALAVPLNNLFCFFAYVGLWKELDPPDMVALKRTLDQHAHVSAPLFDADFLPLYNAFVDACFTTFGGWGQDARLRTHTGRRRVAAGARWSADWANCFVAPEDATAPSEVQIRYTHLMAYLARAMGATEVDAHLLGPGRLPAQFDTETVALVSRTPDDAEVAS